MSETALALASHVNNIALHDRSSEEISSGLCAKRHLQGKEGLENAKASENDAD
ncbi:hypothetical protein D3C83_161500 [compost metagenome]